MSNSDFLDPLDETHAMSLEARTEIRREFLAARRTVALWHPRPELPGRIPDDIDSRWKPGPVWSR